MTHSTTKQKSLNRIAIPSLLTCLTAMVAILSAPRVLAQTTLTLTPVQTNYFAGANFVGSYTNWQIKATVSNGDPNNPITVAAASPPAGVTVGFSTNNFTNSQTITLNVSVANVAAGRYPLTIQATTNGTPIASVSVNLNAGDLWTNVSTSAVNWNSGGSANWTTGVPGAGADVMFQDAGQNTNFVDTSTTVDSLTYIRSLSGTNINTTIASGATLSVLGTNGFAANVDSIAGSSKTFTVNIAGAGASLLVSNQNANFTVSAVNSGSSGTTLAMTNLDNFKAVVNRFGLGDAAMANQGGVGAQLVKVALAKTNYISASFTSDYTVTNAIAYAISIFNNSDAFNNGSANNVDLGASNAIFADSIGVSQSRNGSGNNVVRFNPVFTNGTSAYALFRNTNGGRITLLTVGADAGANAPGSNAKGLLLFNGGTVDMLVDTMWLGRDRNSAATNNNAAATGTLTFGPGTVNVNTLRMGYNEFTNNSWAQGVVNVNTNGLLTVNDFIELGYVAGDYNNGLTAAQSFGQLNVNNGGVVRANRIIVQPGSTNNQITVNVGGNLFVTNTIGSPTNSLTQLKSDGGNLTFSITAGVTNAFVTNLVTTVNATKINIASVSGFASYPATNVLIAYQTAASHNFSIGTLPPGFNNMQINDNTGNDTIELIINTNAPKTLAWRGGASSQWNHLDLNWLDLNSLAITKFTDGDIVIFDDTASVPTSIDITETILPGQSGTGVLVTNNVNNFTFNNSGGSIGGSTLVKTGTQKLQLDTPSSLAAQVQQGTLSGSGTLNSANVFSGAVLDFSGTINGALVSAGTTTIEVTGSVGGATTFSGITTNAGTISGGTLTLQSGGSLYNSGTLGNIGAATTATNTTFINAGTLGVDGTGGNTLTVNGTFEDMGSPTTTIFLDTIINQGTFIPGGDGIGTTLMSFNHTSNTRFMRLQAGSTTIFKVNLANVPPYTTIDASKFTFGPSHGLPKAFDGCTLLITNQGAPYSGPQTLSLFVNSFDGPQIKDAGLNTTNSYPVIVPSSPGAGLAWDVVSDLMFPNPDGNVKIVNIATNPTNITSSFSVTSSNVVTHITWPADHIGWSLQQLNTTTAVGVTATNWVTVFGSAQVNDMFITNNSPAGNAAVFYRLINQ
jgi:hypothetical protein